MDNKYFALETTDKIGERLLQKTDDFYNFIEGNGYLSLWRDVHYTYYNGFYTKGQILPSGKQGEKREMTVNDFASILQHIKVLTTDQRPAFQPKAINTDYKSAAQVSLAKSLLDYYMRQENLEDVIDTCLDYALQSGEGYIFLEWDADKGKVVGELVPEEEPEEIVEEEITENVTIKREEEDGEKDEVKPKIKREGNISAVALHPIDVIRDWYKDNTENNDWFIIRKRVNKFELAARYPRFETEITNTEMDARSTNLRTIDDYDFKSFGESEQTYVFIFRHRKTAALPDGRQVEFLNDGTVIFDGDLPYSELEVFRMMPQKRAGTNFGYTVAFDMLPLQQAIDMIDSIIITNQNAFGTQNVLVKRGSGITASQLTQGLNKIEYNGDQPPQPLKILSTAPELFTYKNELIQRMETISGVNSVSRGNPEASLRSGSALALVQSMAIQFNSGLQHSYAQMLEKTGSGVIHLLQDYAHSPRIALISGISKRAYLKEFKSDNLDLIDRVVVDMGNPMAKTLAGRLQIADTLVEKGLIKSPEQYLQVMETGNLDPLIEGSTTEIMNIRSENERLIVAEQVAAIYTDNHWLHIKEHKCVLSSPDSREVQEVVVKVLAHINEHISLLRKTDPGILMILGQQPIPSPYNNVGGGMPAPMVPGQQEDNTPMQGQVGTPPPGGPEALELNTGGAGKAVNGVELPSMPKNALTNKEFNTSDGGL